MRRSQGRPFFHEEINRIKFLLTSMDMTLQEFAIPDGLREKFGREHQSVFPD
jgi:hypothetical protein